MIFLSDYYGMSEEILWDSYGISLWILCYFHVISMIYDLSMRFLRGSYGISVIFLWDSYGMSIESKLKFN